jgi:hypothetical protein
VVFGSTDTTSGRVALVVNAAAGFPLASNKAGYLVFTSHTSGSSSNITLSDGTPGTLSKLGMAPGSYSGVSAPTDGVVTLSFDGLGGTAPHSTDDGKNLVTDGGKLIYYDHVSGSLGRKLMQLIPGGLPIVGKITFNGTNFLVTYYAKITPRAKVRSFGSFFSLLDGTNSLDVNVNGIGFTVLFPSPPYTRDTVLDQINNAYNFAKSISDPYARVDGTVQSPYFGLSGTSFTVEVDGGSQQVVTFSTEQSLSDVKNRINAVLVGAVAIAYPDPTVGPNLAIRSSNANGRTSSLKIYSGNSCLETLGILPGFYGGSHVASQYGPDEIEIFSVFRGYGNGGLPDIAINGSPTSLSRLGLSVTLITGFSVSDYEPVPAPYFSSSMSAASFNAVMCFPEVLEFGSVPEDIDTQVQKFLAKSSGSNVDERNNPVNVLNGQVYSPQSGRGFFDVGKPVVVPADGTLGVGGFGGTDNQVLKQIVRLSSTEIVQAVIGSKFETPTSINNNLPEQPFMGFYADPTNQFSTRGFNFYVGPSNLAVSIEDNSSGSTPADQSYLGVNDGRSISFRSNEGRISDVNTIGAGETGYLRLTSATDKYLRLGETYALPSKITGYNVVRSLNARHFVTVGDGINTFGDFNGTNGLSQAVNYLIASGVTVCHIVMKPGSYTEPSTVDFSLFSDVILEGVYPSVSSPSTSISLTVSSIAAIQSTSLTNSFILRNLSVSTSVPGSQTVFIRARYVVVDNCILGSNMGIWNASYVMISRSTSICSSDSPVTFVMDDNGQPRVESLIVKNCKLASCQDQPIIGIIDSTSSSRISISRVVVTECNLQPGHATMSGISTTTPAVRTFVSSSGAGIFGIVPSQNAYGPTQVGVVIENLEVDDVDVILGSVGYNVSNVSFIALNVVPSGPQGNQAWSYTSDLAVKIDNVRIEDMRVVFPDSLSTPTQMQSPCITIAGIGIPPTSSPGSGTLVFKNVTIDVQQNIHGPATSNMLPFFGNYQVLSNSTQGGLVCLSGDSIVIENLSFLNTIDLCGSPELLVAPYEHMTIDGFETMPAIPSVSPPSNLLTTTNARMWVRDIFGTMESVIQGVIMDGGGQVSEKWINSLGGFVVFEGSSGIRTGVHFSDFAIKNFISSSTFGPGISIREVSGHGSWPTQLKGGGITIEDGYIGSSGLGSSGLAGFSNGISAIASASNVSIDGIAIRNVKVDSTHNNGIVLSLQTVNSPVSIVDCTVSLCGNAAGNGGIKVSTNNTSSSASASVIVRDNNVFRNNIPSSGQYNGIQINVRDIGSTHFPTAAAVYGNNCFDNIGYVWGKINSCQCSNVNLPSSGSFITPLTIMALGLETGYSGQTGSFASLGNGYLWTPGSRCMHNNAFLNSDFNNAQ